MSEVVLENPHGLPLSEQQEADVKIAAGLIGRAVRLCLAMKLHPGAIGNVLLSEACRMIASTEDADERARQAARAAHYVPEVVERHRQFLSGQPADIGHG